MEGEVGEVGGDRLRIERGVGVCERERDGDGGELGGELGGEGVRLREGRDGGGGGARWRVGMGGRGGVDCVVEIVNDWRSAKVIQCSA